MLYLYCLRISYVHFQILSLLGIILFNLSRDSVEHVGIVVSTIAWKKNGLSFVNNLSLLCSIFINLLLCCNNVDLSIRYVTFITAVSYLYFTVVFELHCPLDWDLCCSFTPYLFFVDWRCIYCGYLTAHTCGCSLSR